MAKSIFFFSLLIILTPPLTSTLFAQESAGVSEILQEENYTPPEYEYKRDFVVAAGALIFPNIIIGSWNRFVTQSPWAQVSWDDVTHFYEHEWEWDGDWYWTNFVLHPYQGSLTYMGARSANFTAYEAVLWAGASSLMWEYFFETNAPSLNDLIYTTIGALPVGEMMWRLSYEISQIWAPLKYPISPTRIWADPAMAWMHKKTREPKEHVTSLSLATMFGSEYGKTFVGGDYESKGELYPVHGGAELSIVYGDPYTHESIEPYSQFELVVGGKLGPGNGEGYKPLEEKLRYDVHILSNGFIYSKAVDFGENKETSLGIILDYDFIWQSFFDVSSLAPGFGIKQKIALKNDNTFEWQAHADALILGTVDFYYYRRNILPNATNYRPYSYGIGGELVGKAKWTHGSGLNIAADLHTYAIYDFYSQLTGSASAGWEFIGLCKAAVEMPVSATVSFGVADTFYCKGAIYNSLPNLFAFMNEAELYARFRLK